jgi:hypothetical protein
MYDVFIRDGKCVDGIWQIDNTHVKDVNFELYVQKDQCTSRNDDKYPVAKYDTYGASKWERIPDVLEMYGMCSYRHWFEFLEYAQPTNSSLIKKCDGLHNILKCLPNAVNVVSDSPSTVVRCEPFCVCSMKLEFQN